MEKTDYVKRVEDIFITWFGDENIDVQYDIADSPYVIFVKFDNVRVTNDNNKYIDIEGLYVQVPLSPDGTMHGCFRMNRSTYTHQQWNSGYVHSHVPYLEHFHPEKFRSPCLGTGPIRRTIATLNAEFNEDIWNLFCTELNLYVQTESLRGGPYIRLETLGRNQTGHENYYDEYWFDKDYNILDFYPWFFSHFEPEFSFYDGKYHIAMQFSEFIIKASQMFITWQNEVPTASSRRKLSISELINYHILILGTLSTDGYRDIVETINVGISRQPSQPVCICMFKGNPVMLNIHENAEDVDDLAFSFYLAPNIIRFLYTAIDIIINFNEQYVPKSLLLSDIEHDDSLLDITREAFIEFGSTRGRVV